MTKPPQTPSRIALARRRATAVKIGAVVAASTAFVVTAVAARTAHTGSTATTTTEETTAPPRRLSDQLPRANETPFSESSLVRLAEPAISRLSATGLGQLAASAQRTLAGSGLSEVAVPIVALAVSLLAPGVIGDGDDAGEPKARSSSS